MEKAGMYSMAFALPLAVLLFRSICCEFRQKKR